MASVDEKKALITISELEAQPLQSAPGEEEATPEHLVKAEYTLLAAIFIHITMIAAVLNLSVQKPAILCKINPSLIPLARVLPRSLYLGMPMCLVFLVASPYIAAKRSTGVAQCMVVFCYLLGAVWGAELFVLAGLGPARVSCGTR